MTSIGSHDSDRELDSILAVGETEELARLRVGLNLEAGLAAIVSGKSEAKTDLHSADSGEPRILARDPNQLAPILDHAQGTPQHCALLAMDIVGFEYSTSAMQVAVRQAFYAVLTGAFNEPGLGLGDCYREDRGDGLLVIIPAHVSAITVVGPLLDRLRAGLRRHNSTMREDARIRLRVAVHSGEVHRDRYGVSGSALIRLFRLLDAPVVRASFVKTGSDLALIVSDNLYQSVIRAGYRGIDPGTFQSVTVAIKETRAQAWLQLPQFASGSRRPLAQPESTETYESLGLETEPVLPPSTDQVLAGSPAAAEILPFRWER